MGINFEIEFVFWHPIPQKVRFNSQAVKEILLFTEKMTKYPVNVEVKRKMIHISMSVLEMLSSSFQDTIEEFRFWISFWAKDQSAFEQNPAG